MNSPIPFHIISGFLGSGKTTFILEILREMAGKHRIGIIQNEFAPASIDGAILKQTNQPFSLLELNNGSVFCVCLMGDFIQSLVHFIDTIPLDVLILEASGLSDTPSVAEIISHPMLTGKIYLAKHWCIVDALNFEKTGKMQQRVIHQLRMADTVILNKTDLVPQKIENITRKIRSINPFATILGTSFCKVPFTATELNSGISINPSPEPLGRPGIRSMVIKTTRRITEDKLQKFLALWAPHAFRIKGFVVLHDQSAVSVQCVFGSIEIKPVEGWNSPTEMVALTDQFILREWNQSFREISDN